MKCLCAILEMFTPHTVIRTIMAIHNPNHIQRWLMLIGAALPELLRSEWRAQ